MMKRKIQLYITLLAVFFSVTACLDKYPEDAIPEGEAIRTISDVDQAVIGVYAAFKGTALYSGLLTLLPDLQSDLVYAVNGYSNTYGDVWRWEMLSTNNEITNVYGALYNIISRCNFIFDYIGEVEANTTDDDQLEKLDSYKGELYFARALAYSELLKMFCKAYEDDATAENELGVVLRTSYHKPERLIRASLKDSYQFVLDDLEKAAGYLELEKNNTTILYNTSYFTIGTVNALYARVYLYMNKYDEAITYASKVIDSKKYILSDINKNSYSVDVNDYDYMWHYDNSTEIIWKVNFELTSYGGALGTIFLGYDYTSYRPDYVPASWVLKLYPTADKRYESFFASTTTGYSHGLTWPLLAKYAGNQNFIANRILFVSMPKPFRLSEMYLIRAEAYSRCNRHLYGEASKDITILRSARYSSYASANITAENWQEVIEGERVKELYMEGFRLMDLKRWHKGFEREPQANTVSPGNNLKIEKDHPLFVWPIPQHELESPGAEIQPNESNK